MRHADMRCDSPARRQKSSSYAAICHSLIVCRAPTSKIVNDRTAQASLSWGDHDFLNGDRVEDRALQIGFALGFIAARALGVL
jgi:hypothetical protein